MSYLLEPTIITLDDVEDDEETSGEATTEDTEGATVREGTSDRR